VTAAYAAQPNLADLQPGFEASVRELTAVMIAGMLARTS
jgi:hypothetical protein